MDMIIDHAHETFVRWGHHNNQGWKSACCHHFLRTWPDFQSCDPSWPSSDVSMGVILHVAVVSGKIIHVFCASAKTFNLAFHKRCLKWDIWKLLHNSPCESLYVVGSLTDPFSRTQKWKCNENVVSFESLIEHNCFYSQPYQREGHAWTQTVCRCFSMLKKKRRVMAHTHTHTHARTCACRVSVWLCSRPTHKVFICLTGVTICFLFSTVLCEGGFNWQTPIQRQIQLEID